MTLLRFMPWLRNCCDALVARCVTLIQHRRMQRAQAQLPSVARERASFWRTLYLARNARLQREREARRRARASSANDLPSTRDISKADVLAAIARSRASRETRLKAARDERKS
jgi:hypothetical protein